MTDYEAWQVFGSEASSGERESWKEFDLLEMVTVRRAPLTRLAGADIRQREEEVGSLSRGPQQQTVAGHRSVTQ